MKNIKSNTPIHPFLDSFNKNKLEPIKSTGIDYTDVSDVNLDDTPKKYDRGLNRYLDQESNRASNQTGWEARGNALVQAANEVVLGTLEGIGHAADLPQYAQILGLMEGSDKEYSNWFSNLMKKGKENVNEEFSIHGGEGFDPTNPRWWSKNAPSLASSLTLLIPSTAMAKGLGTVGKGIRIANTNRKISKAAKLGNTKKIKDILKAQDKVAGNTEAWTGIRGAITSRYLENTMESSGTYKDEFEKALSQNKTEEEAKDIAGKAASNVWYANLINLPIDIMQYSILFGRSSKMVKEMADKAAKAKFKDKLLDVGATMVGEGIEEGIQYGIQKEAAKSDGVWDVYKNIIKNGSQYFEDPEFTNAMFLGAIGGGVFKGGGEAIKSTTSTLNPNNLKNSLLYPSKSPISAKLSVSAFFHNSETSACTSSLISQSSILILPLASKSKSPPNKRSLYKR